MQRRNGKESFEQNKLKRHVARYLLNAKIKRIVLRQLPEGHTRATYRLCKSCYQAVSSHRLDKHIDKKGGRVKADTNGNIPHCHCHTDSDLKIRFDCFDNETKINK